MLISFGESEVTDIAFNAREYPSQRQAKNRMNEEEQKTLIRRIEPGQKNPVFWSRTNDFFISEKRTNFSTSFSECFGFEAATEVPVRRPPPGTQTAVDAQGGEVRAAPEGNPAGEKRSESKADRKAKGTHKKSVKTKRAPQ
jgi:hypothetical protein